MNAFVGMDIQAVRTLAQQLTGDAEEIDQIATKLTSQLDGTQWVGTDANSFRDSWNGSYRQQLATVVNALRDAATAATNNANQQEQASAN
jgi:uncharacterized protein YukE